MATTAAYKKAYVVLREPISLPDNLFPFNFFEEEERRAQEQEDKEKQMAAEKRARRPRRNSSTANLC